MSALSLPHGAHRDVPSAIYHARVEGLASKSVLDMIHRSPAHYRVWLDGHEEPPTPPLIFGGAFHCSLLEPAVYSQAYGVVPDFGDCRKTENKARRDAWRARNAGRIHIDEDDDKTIQAMIRAVHAHPLAGRMIRDGEPELTVRWKDEATDIECKARGDYFVPRHRMLLDVKSSQDASPEAFRKSIADFGYHRQDAFYRAGFRAVGLDVEHFVFVVVEKTPPHAVAVYALDADGIQRGAASIAKDLETLAECLRTKTWPGYPVEIKTLELPPWAA